VSDILKDLNPQQKEAVTTTEGPLLIIAGAGTGKTTVIAKRIAYIIEKKLAKPSEILALTFTDKAAGEMEERVDVAVPYGFIDTWISTFHAFGDRVLRDNAIDIGLSPDFKILSRPQQILFLQQNLFRMELDYFRPLGNPTKFISAFLTFFSRLKDENIKPKEFETYAKERTKKAKGNEIEKIEAQKYLELASAYLSYEKFKEEADLLDFGDQVTKAIDLFSKRPKILVRYQQQFKYILVDEYQDTNYSQNELVKMLAKSHKNICVVGDDDQSIYKFRGAAVSNILQFVKNFPGAKQVVLTQNFRSTQKILDSAYKLIRNNDPDRLEVQNKIDKKLKSQKGVGLPPQEIYANTISEEADLVAAEIEKLIKNKKYSYRDFAILVRAHSQADYFLRALNMKGIPHKFVGSTGLYQQREVSVLINYLKALTDFEDSLNLYSLLTSEIYNLPQEDAIKLTSYAKRKNRSLYFILKKLESIENEDLKLDKVSKKIIETMFSDLEAGINLSRSQKAGKVLYDFLNRTKYLSDLSKSQDTEDIVKIQNIAKFFEKIEEFEQIAKAETTIQFVQYLEIIRSAGDDPATVEFDPELDAVNVMTIHGAKGLEFPIVFMVNLVSDRFPTKNRGEAIELPEALIKESLPKGDWHHQEERRLFYVGATRAKDLLYFTWSRDLGGKRLKKLSPFVLEALDSASTKAQLTKLSPFEKIERFAPISPQMIQSKLFDVDVLKLTQGSIDDYLTCAYKYRYVHVLRVPVLRHHSVVYGAALHNAIAAFLRSKKNGNLLTLPQVLEVFENVWDSEGFLTLEHEKKRKNQGKKALEAFYNREKESKVIPGLIEQKFAFTLKDTTIKGRFDRVDISAGSKVKIIDYKSSENIDQDRANSQAKESIQLVIYALYYFKTHKILPEEVILYFLENGITGSYKPTEKDLEKAENLILETSAKIRHDSKNNAFAAKPKYFGREPACVYCAFQTICPYSLTKLR